MASLCLHGWSWKWLIYFGLFLGRIPLHWHSQLRIFIFKSWSFQWLGSPLKTSFLLFQCKSTEFLSDGPDLLTTHRCLPAPILQLQVPVLSTLLPPPNSTSVVSSCFEFSFLNLYIFMYESNERIHVNSWEWRLESNTRLINSSRSNGHRDGSDGLEQY